MGLRAFLPLLALLLLAGAAPAPAAADGPDQIAVFWGRHKDEGSLREACDTGLYRIVIVSFFSVFGHGRYWLDLSGHPLHDVGADIKHCQSKAILVLLSIGGQGGDYSLPSSQSAVDLADNLWNAYLGGGRAGVFRPFGDAAVDGIDFFIDQGSTEHYDELARRLYSYNKYYRGRDGVLLTATPRCSYPDNRLEKALATGLFARIHVRMFGDPDCTLSPRYSWEKWAAAYPNSQVFVGLVASPEQDSAWMFQKDLYYEMLQFIRKLPNYGGLMIWDRYYDKKTNYTSY